MDAGGIGALIGVSVMIAIGVSTYVYDRCVYHVSSDIRTINPLLIKKKSFKVKDLFNHVQI